MLNILNIKSFDMRSFEENYRIFHIVQRDKNIIETRNDITVIYSVAYRTSQDFYVLTPRQTTDKDITKLFTPFRFDSKEVTIDEVEEWLLLNLFINKQSNRNLEFNNLSAECYFLMDQKENEYITLGFSCDSSNVLSCKVKTFSRVNSKTIPNFTPKTRKALEKNTITKFTVNKNHIVRDPDVKHTDFLIMRKSREQKNTMNFFTIDFAVNKTAEMFALLQRINNEEYGIVELEFKEKEIVTVLETKRLTKDEEFSKIISRTPESLKLNVIDHCGLREKVAECMDNFGIRYEFSSDFKKDAMNLSLIMTKGAYKTNGLEDEYRKSGEMIIQNLTDKDIKKAKGLKSKVKQCYLEMLLKYEVVNGTIMAEEMKGAWNFYKVFNKTPHKLTIEDGKIMDMSSLGITEDISSILTNDVSADTRIVEHDGGRIFIYKTNLRMIPDYNTYLDSKSTYVEEKDGKSVNKARHHRRRLYKEIIDFNSFEYMGEKYYSIGEIGHGMNTSIANSPSTRRVVEEGLSIEDISYLMNPNIYQINKIASYPYPFKLMNEIYVINGGELENE